MNKIEMAFYAARALTEISRHVGKQNAIGMGELYEIVFKETWANRINDTRRLRKIITELRKQGAVILSTCSPSRPGYYNASIGGSEAREYLKKRRQKNLRALVLDAKMEKIGLPELQGQLEFEFNMVGNFDEAA